MQSGGGGGQFGGSSSARSQAPGLGARGRMGPRFQPITVEDVIQSDVETVEPDTPIPTVVAQFAEQNVGSVVVMDDDRPTGVLTDRTVCLALEDNPDLSDLTAGDLVAADLVTASTEDTLFGAVATMSEAGVRRLPIVDEDGTLAGIGTLDDVLVVLGTELHNAVDIVREQAPRF